MEYGPADEESTESAARLGDAAHEAFLESDMPATDYNAAIVAEVAAAASEAGFVEASKMADRVTDEEKASDVLRFISKGALRSRVGDRTVLHDLVVLLSSSHTADYYHERRRANAIQRQLLLELSVRRSNRRNETNS